MVLKKIPKNMPKGMEPILNLLILLEDMSKCIKEKCKIEYKKQEKAADAIALNNLREDLKNEKISSEKFLEQFSKLKLNILKSEIREELVKCQLNKCYSQTKKLIDISASTILKSKTYSKDEPIYKLAKKISNYKNKKLTYKVITDLDIESHLKIYGKYIKN